MGAAWRVSGRVEVVDGRGRGFDVWLLARIWGDKTLFHLPSEPPRRGVVACGSILYMYVCMSRSE